MEEPLLKEAFEMVESAIVNQMTRVDVSANKAHTDLIVTLQLLHKVKGYLQTVIDTGKMVALDEEKKSWADRFRKRA